MEMELVALTQDLRVRASIKTTGRTYDDFPLDLQKGTRGIAEQFGDDTKQVRVVFEHSKRNSATAIVPREALSAI
jgi:hypothetical protein